MTLRVLLLLPLANLEAEQWSLQVVRGENCGCTFDRESLQAADLL